MNSDLYAYDDAIASANDEIPFFLEAAPHLGYQMEKSEFSRGLVIDLCCGVGIYHEMLLKFFRAIHAHDMNAGCLWEVWLNALRGGYNRRIHALTQCCLTDLSITADSDYKVAFGTGVLGFLNVERIHKLLEMLYKSKCTLMLLRERVSIDNKGESMHQEWQYLVRTIADYKQLLRNCNA